MGFSGNAVGSRVPRKKSPEKKENLGTPTTLQEKKKIMNELYKKEQEKEKKEKEEKEKKEKEKLYKDYLLKKEEKIIKQEEKEEKIEENFYKEKEEKEKEKEEKEKEEKEKKEKIFKVSLELPRKNLFLVGIISLILFLLTILTLGLLYYYKKMYFSKPDTK